MIVLIHADDYRDDVSRVLQAVGLPQCAVEYVESVQDWAEAVGIGEGNPDRVAMALRADGEPRIILKREISEDDRLGIIGRMLYGGFDEQLSRLESPEAFLEHLVLHEAAHLLLPDGASEDDCDEWAFEHLALRIARRTA